MDTQPPRANRTTSGTARGGFFGVSPTVLLHSRAWRTLADKQRSLGAWFLIRSHNELTGEPCDPDAIKDFGISAETLEILRDAGLLLDVPGGCRAEGMPGPARRPSDEPDQTRDRQRRHREEKAKAAQEAETKADADAEADTGHAVTNGHELSRRDSVTSPSDEPEKDDEDGPEERVEATEPPETAPSPGQVPDMSRTDPDAETPNDWCFFPRTHRREHDMSATPYVCRICEPRLRQAGSR
jgi:hypothetical protein